MPPLRCELPGCGIKPKAGKLARRRSRVFGRRPPGPLDEQAAWHGNGLDRRGAADRAELDCAAVVVVTGPASEEQGAVGRTTAAVAIGEFDHQLADVVSVGVEVDGVHAWTAIGVIVVLSEVLLLHGAHVRAVGDGARVVGVGDVLFGRLGEHGMALEFPDRPLGVRAESLVRRELKRLRAPAISATTPVSVSGPVRGPAAVPAYQARLAAAEKQRQLDDQPGPAAQAKAVHGRLVHGHGDRLAQIGIGRSAVNAAKRLRECSTSASLYSAGRADAIGSSCSCRRFNTRFSLV